MVEIPPYPARIRHQDRVMLSLFGVGRCETGQDRAWGSTWLHRFLSAGMALALRAVVLSE
jgi:hypothetical protein